MKKSTHNIYLTPQDKSFPEDHIFNTQITSSKGCITTDQIPDSSALKTIYKSDIFKKFIAEIVGEKILYEYEDPLSSINVHYAKEGQELGWHFDNSSFAVTLLLQKPLGGGIFEYVKNVRNSESGEMGFEEAEKIVSGRSLTVFSKMPASVTEPTIFFAFTLLVSGKAISRSETVSLFLYDRASF